MLLLGFLALVLVHFCALCQDQISCSPGAAAASLCLSPASSSCALMNFSLEHAPAHCACGFFKVRGPLCLSFINPGADIKRPSELAYTHLLLPDSAGMDLGFLGISRFSAAYFWRCDSSTNKAALYAQAFENSIACGIVLFQAVC